MYMYNYTLVYTSFYRMDVIHMHICHNIFINPRCQQVHFEIAEVLAELKEYQLSVDIDKEEEDDNNKCFD